MFRLGNFNIDEIIQGAAEDFSGNLLYTLDQLSSASIEISSESQDITDKNGNIVRTIYKSKQGTFTATNAFLHLANADNVVRSKVGVDGIGHSTHQQIATEEIHYVAMVFLREALTIFVSTT